MKKKFKGLLSKFKKKAKDEGSEDESAMMSDEDDQELEDDEEYEYVDEDEDEEEDEEDDEKTSKGFFSKIFKKSKKETDEDDEEWEEEDEDEEEEIVAAPEVPADTPPIPTEDSEEPPATPQDPTSTIPLPDEGTQEIDPSLIEQAALEQEEEIEHIPEHEEAIDFDEMPRPEGLAAKTKTSKFKALAGLVAGLKSRMSFGKSKSPKVELESDTTSSLSTSELELDSSGTMDLKSRVQNLIHNFDPQSIIEICQKILSPAFRPQVNRAFIIASMAGIAYGTGKIAALVVKGDNYIPATPVSIDTDHLKKTKVDKVVATNLFNALLEPVKKEQVAKKAKKKAVFDKDAICVEARQNSKLPLKLMNTIVLQDTVKSVASIQTNQKNKILNLREGDKIGSLAAIGRIGRLEVIIRNLKSGQCEKIINKAKVIKTKKQLKILDPTAGQKLIESQKPKGIKNEGNKYTVSRKLLKEKLANINEILTQARAIQIENPDGTLSFKLTEIEAGSVYNFIGLQNEDKITHINGKAIANLNEIFNLFGKIQKVNELSVTVQRSGEETLLDYSITDK